MFYFPLNAWVNSVAVHMETHCVTTCGALSINEQRPTDGLLRKRGNYLVFTFSQLVFHLFCKEPTVIQTSVPI